MAKIIFTNFKEEGKKKQYKLVRSWYKTAFIASLSINIIQGLLWIIKIF